MKTLSKSIVFFSICLLFFSFTYAGNSKQLKPIQKHKVEFNLLQFCNYLENGSPNRVEGVYSSPDQRYQVAIVKNDVKGHDYIGIVLSADNPYWQAGEVKFNFVEKDSSLIGYYYNSSGEKFPIELKIDSDTLKTNHLNKMKIKQVIASL